MLPESASQAVNNKKSVSCPAGGRNYGQSGGRNLFIFSIFVVVDRKTLSIFGKRIFFCKYVTTKKVPSRPFFRHPAASPETTFYFRVASQGTVYYESSSTIEYIPRPGPHGRLGILIRPQSIWPHQAINGSYPAL